MASSTSRVLRRRGGWLVVPGVHAVPTLWETPTEVIKEHINPTQFATESRLLQIAQAAGCAPEFAVEPPLTLVLRRHRTLDAWLSAASTGDRLAMARRILTKVRRLHAAGVCHRDLKPDDVVVAGDEPLLVDFELGTDVDPGERCYDTLGPSASGVPLPFVHAVVGLRHGVWWDTRSPMIGRPMWHVFGRLSEVEE